MKTFIIWLDFIPEDSEPIFTLTEKDSPDNEVLLLNGAVVLSGFEEKQIFPDAIHRFNMVVMYEMSYSHLVDAPKIDYH